MNYQMPEKSLCLIRLIQILAHIVFVGENVVEKLKIVASEFSYNSIYVSVRKVFSNH